MKILFNIAGIRPLFDQGGGAIQKIVSCHVANLAENYKIIIFGQALKKYSNFKLCDFSKQIPIRNIKEMILNSILVFRKIFGVKADLIISTHQRNLLASLLYSKIKRKPLIAWELDHVFWVEPETKVKKLYHYLIKYADLIIAISSIQKQRMIRYGVDPNKIKLMYNCINTEKYCPKQRKNSNNKYFLYVAKLTKRKNHLTLLKAFKKISSYEKYNKFKLVLIGPKVGAYTSTNDVTSDYFNQCLDYIKRNHLTERVRFIEDVSERKLISLYQDAYIFICPSTEEGFGLTLLEAMSCGCATITNDIEPLSEVTGDSGLLIDALDSNLLSQSIIKLLENDQLREELSRRARKRAVQIFDAKEVSQRLQELITGASRGQNK